MNKQRTIVILNDYASVVGGAAKVALSSAVALANRGNRTIVFSAVGPIDDSLKNVPNLEVICLNQSDILSDPNRFRAITSGTWNRVVANELTQLLQKLRADKPVVHFHPWVKALSPSVFVAARRCGVPSVITLHDYFIACPTGNFLEAKTGKICKRKPLSASCISCNCDPRNYFHKIWRVSRGFVQKNVARVPSQCENFISVSPYSEAILREFLPAKANITLVRCPIDVDHQPVIDAAASRDFLFVGRFSPEKGAVDFAKAAAASGQNAVFIGQGGEEEKIREACPNAKILGWLPPAEVQRQMRQARALVFPSRWYETQGLSAIEACAVGLPVIYSDVTAISADLQDNATGISYRSGDVEDLNQKMVRVANDDAFARSIGTAAYDWYWKTPWTLDHHVDGLEAVYDRLLRNYAVST